MTGALDTVAFWSETDLSFIPGITCRRVELNELEKLGLDFGVKLLETFLKKALPLPIP